MIARKGASVSQRNPSAGNRWSRRKLAAVLYPFVTAAVAINLFLASLLSTWLGVSVLSPVASLLLSLPLGLPASWATARWVDGLLDKAQM